MARDATLADFVGLIQELESLLDRPVDVKSDDAVHPRIREKVNSTAVPL